MLTLQHHNYPTSGTAGTNPDTEFGVLRDANGDLSAPLFRVVNGKISNELRVTFS